MEESAEADGAWVDLGGEVLCEERCVRGREKACACGFFFFVRLRNVRLCRLVRE